MGAPVVIRRGSDIIYVHKENWAHEVVFGKQQTEAQGIEDCISRLAKTILNSLEVAAGRNVQGLGQALLGVRRGLDPGVAKRIRGLHEAAGFVRHLTQVGEQHFINEVSTGLEAFQQTKFSMANTAEKGVSPRRRVPQVGYRGEGQREDLRGLGRRHLHRGGPGEGECRRGAGRQHLHRGVLGRAP